MTGHCSSTSFKPGAEHWNWKGDQVGYLAAHDRVRAAFGKASQFDCRRCGQPARDWAYDGLDSDERTGVGAFAGFRYSADPLHYRPLCRRCNLAEGRSPARSERDWS